MKKIILLSLTFLTTVGSIQSKTASNSLPGGSYQSTCKNCKYNNNTQMLTCACRTGSGDYNYSTITVTSDTIITNSNGTLTNGLVSSGEDADDDDTDE